MIENLLLSLFIYRYDNQKLITCIFFIPLCTTGTCECDPDFGAGDCSINLNDPPLVFAINRETGGLCDRNFCNEAIVIGDLFLNRPDLMCKMQRFQVWKMLIN